MDTDKVIQDLNRRFAAPLPEMIPLTKPAILPIQTFSLPVKRQSQN